MDPTREYVACVVQGDHQIPRYFIGLGTCPPLQWLLTRQGTGSGGILSNTARPGGAEGMICVCLSYDFVHLFV